MLSDYAQAPAVVIGGDLNPLGIVRSLAAAGVPVTVIATDPHDICMRSRFGRKVLFTAIEGPGFVVDLLDLAKEWRERPVLFLTEERTVRTVSEYRDRITPAYRVRLPEHGRLMKLMHKKGFQDLAEACGALIPRTLHLRSHNDLARLGEIEFPCVLKPARKDYVYGAQFKKAYVVQSPQEVEKLYTEIAPVLSDLVLQQWIDGDDSDIYFTLQYVGADGATVSTFTGRKIRSWPPRIGGTASCTAAWNEAQELDALTARFFSQVGFTGMGSMEYKRDRRDGKFYMIEPTVARTDVQEEVATLNGVNIPFAAYRYELGLSPVASSRTQVARIWREPESDRWSAERTGTAVDERSQGDRTVDAYWRLNDPMPWVSMMRDRIAQRIEMWRRKLGLVPR